MFCYCYQCNVDNDLRAVNFLVWFVRGARWRGQGFDQR